MKVIVAGNKRNIMKAPVAAIAATLLLAFVVVLYNISGNPSEKGVLSPTNVRADESSISAALSTLEYFGASSAEEAVDIWSKGVCARNGLTQYSVMNSELKEQYLSVAEGKYGGLLFPADEKTIDGWYISDIQELEDGRTKVQVQFSISDASGQSAAAIAELTVSEEAGYAALSSVAVEKALYAFTGIG
ncbi:MAG: hypothetical protein LBL09_02520 [Oscillospiraceae bacterium]|jgi:hypothetical protein|nr:hypothetical protein [Oscillospiraceae bacterium]